MSVHEDKHEHAMATEARVRAGHRGAVWRLIAGENAFFHGQRAKFCAFQMRAARVCACELGWLKIKLQLLIRGARVRGFGGGALGLERLLEFPALAFGDDARVLAQLAGFLRRHRGVALCVHTVRLLR